MMKMNAYARRLALLVLLVSGSFALAGQVVRIDGSSEEAANRSFQHMMESLKADQQQALLAALIQINLGGAESVYDALRNPKMQHPSAGQIRDKIAGLTAAEIIEFANKAGTARAIIKGQEPGL